jgi:hypothetical protein
VTAFAITLAIATAFIALGIWSRREIDDDRNVEVEFIDHEIRNETLHTSMRWFSIFTQTTWYFIVAAGVILIGVARLLGWLE